jgi:hypothetical protein
MSFLCIIKIKQDPFVEAIRLIYPGQLESSTYSKLNQNGSNDVQLDMITTYTIN